MLDLTPDQLVARFEALGDNCEFGVMQRFCAAEPLGLLRFSGASLANVIHVIETGGSHLFTADDMSLAYAEHAGEYLLRSKHYNDFESHTGIMARVSDEENLCRKRLKILSYLKARFFQDMRSAEKIYVRKGGESIVELRRLHAALRKFGPKSLLCVAEADAFHPAGTVETIEDGFWRGFVSRFKSFSSSEPIDIVNWLRILELTLARSRPQYRLRRSSRLAGGRLRQVEARSGTRTDRLSLFSFSLTLNRDLNETPVVASRTFDLVPPPERVVVVSAWVMINVGFSGDLVHVNLRDVKPLHVQHANVKIRGTWQKVWTSLRIPAGHTRGTVIIRVRALRGSSIRIGAWTLETGEIPQVKSPSSFSGIPSFVRKRLRAQTNIDAAGAADTSKLLAWSSKALAEGRFVDVDDALALALANAPGDAALLKQYAFSAHNSGRYVAAIARWWQAASAAPNDPMCCAGVASNFREYGELRCAADAIQNAIERFPDDGTVLTEAARIAMAQRRFDEALALLEKAIVLFGPLGHLTIGRDLAKAQVEAAAEHASRGDIARVAP